MTTWLFISFCIFIVVAIALNWQVLECVIYNFIFRNRLDIPIQLTDNNIVFYFQVYDELGAVEHSLQRLRVVFPKAPVFLISDDGKDFSVLAREFNCHYEYATDNVKVGGADWKWRSWLKRVELMYQHYPKEFLMVMEPDVCINAMPQRPMLADCNSGHNVYNKFRWRFSLYICRSLGLWAYPLGYSCGGGSIIRTQSLIKSAASVTDEDVENMARFDPLIVKHQDALCAAIMLKNNCSFYYHPEIANYCYATKNMPIVHNFKLFYN
jgi:hypothetical protein